jgi:glycosyltransferase involved in cell wall biosynthesis
MTSVSVVMPSFNQAEFLGEAVRSVLGTTGTGVELVVMDGGSTDGSQALLASLSEEFPGRLRWASAPDNGPAEAVTEAVRRARAPLIGWLNSDDLYAAGAIERAESYLVEHPAHVMVYGHGEHVDVDGRFLEPYPTLPPSTPLGVFADGCFICQPTAFFRRDAFLELGGLDTALRASFDFELWLRLFKAYPGRIGFVDAVQAKSRLHAGGITLKFRERVALEGVQVIARHLGPAPGHWLLTHLGELCDTHPFLAEELSLQERFERLVDKASACLSKGTVHELLARASQDRRVQLGDRNVHVGIYPDGWAPTEMEIRVLQGATPVRRITLMCRHHAPQASLLRIRVVGPDGAVQRVSVDGNGEFELAIDCSDLRPQARLVYRVHTEGGFVPAHLERGSADLRSLAFLVDDRLIER